MKVGSLWPQTLKLSMDQMDTIFLVTTLLFSRIPFLFILYFSDVIYLDARVSTMLESLPITAAHRFAFSALFGALLSSPISLAAKVGRWPFSKPPSKLSLFCSSCEN